MEKHLGAIILAAGKGTRMQLQDVNKVTLLVDKKPMIHYAIDVLKSMMIGPIVIVVGHAKQSVIDIITQDSVIFAHQSEQLGTAHAALCALEKLPHDVRDVFVLQGDDAMFYSQDILETLLKKHQETSAALTFLTITVANPTGLGRIIRDDSGKIVAVIEEKNATNEQKKVQEINPACYLFSVAFLRKYLHTVSQNTHTGEYYLTSLIDIATGHNETIATVTKADMQWRGVNTKEELEQAQQLFQTK